PASPGETSSTRKARARINEDNLTWAVRLLLFLGHVVYSWFSFGSSRRGRTFSKISHAHRRSNEAVGLILIARIDHLFIFQFQLVQLAFRACENFHSFLTDRSLSRRPADEPPPRLPV